MKIRDILNQIEVISSYIPDAMYRRTILSLCHDSRKATPTCAFFCKVGSITDGHLYASHAYSGGARIFIAEKKLDLPEDAAVIITPNVATALAKLSVIFYDDPSDQLKIVGITGTKGKTTVALSVYNIALSYGMKVGYIGTNGVYYNGKVLESTNTTPDVLELQGALRNMANEGVTHVMLEVSSQALWQERIYGIKFETCVFTNLYRDHIGGIEHPNFEHYRNCKKLLFSKYGANSIVINHDCGHSKYMLEGIDNKENVITVSASGDKSCSIYANSAMKIKNGIFPGISFQCKFGKEYPNTASMDVFMPMPGLYSVENGLLIIGVCHSLGIPLDFTVRELAHLSIPGRFETVTLISRPESLFVIDYAHNGASLEAVLRSLKEYHPSRIICLFGSVGGRTFERRAELGAVAAKHADIIIVTSDNPNNEDPMDIIEDINESIGKTDKPVYLIADRKEAIQKAVELASPGDYVLLAGKGHERYQLIKNKRVPFSEKDVLKLTDLIYIK